MKEENIYNEIKSIMNSIPEDLSEIEKVRYIYIKVGSIVNYDYRIIKDKNIANKMYDFNSGYISNYLTCYQVCNLLNYLLKSIGIKSKIINKKNGFKIYEYEHTVNEIELSSGEKYIIDLTIDLYLIQSGCQTSEFGKYISEDYDSISLSKLESIDEELGLIKDYEYTDNKINKLKSVDYSDLSYDEEYISKINEIKKLIIKLNGVNESRLFINKLLNELNIPYKYYNLINESNNLVECIQVIGDTDIWYLYEYNSGLKESNADEIKELLNNGYICPKENILEVLNNSINNKM